VEPQSPQVDLIDGDDEDDRGFYVLGVTYTVVPELQISERCCCRMDRWTGWQKLDCDGATELVSVPSE